ncbi:ATP-binding protein [Uliginosibacterium sp. sgz301328]|uniref:PAS domain-containing hybrid sensor histidine kinase/response regulator n=1 Tax=Uliginosibacterium sp. sgz301328 TaxID=3243764 RepID=UPI00359EC4E0
MNEADNGQCWPPRGGGMGALVRATDWSATPLGPLEQWSIALRVAASLVLESRFPKILLWGEQLIQIYNDGYQPILGAKHPRAMGQPTAECWPEVWHFNGPIYERVAQGETVYLEDQEYILYPTRDREVYYLTICYSPVRDERGTVAGVLVTLIDMTRRREAENESARLLTESRASQRILQQWFDQAPGFIALLRGPNHVLEKVNAAYYQLIGHREVLGRPLFDALPDVRNQGFEQILDTVYRSGEPFSGRNLRVVLQRAPNGPLTEAFIDLTYQPVRDANGAVTGIFAQGYDVTEPYRFAQALRDSEERFRLAAESSSLGTFDWNIPQGALRFSAEARAIFDVDQEVIHIEDAYARIHPGDVELVKESIDRCIASDGEERYEVKHRVVHRNGTVRWAHVIGRVRFEQQKDGSNAVGRFIGVIWDITEQHQLVEALREADRRKDRFLATLAHELRNPLAPIRQAVHISRSPNVTERQLRWSQDVIERQVEHMALLLDDLLDVSRISQGRLELRKSQVRLADVIDAALETSRPIIEGKRHTLTIDMADHDISLQADPLRLAQVLSNLLANAAKYTDAGGRIWLSVGADATHVIISVLDNGVGLEPESLPLIFEMFSQVSSVMDRSEGGLGIGLALTKGLVDLHGGTIEVMSTGLGKGAEFVVRLPLPEVRSAPPTAAAPAPRTEAAPCKVLLADDNIDALESLALLLSLDGHDVLCARDGEEAVALAARERPDVAIFDIGMPCLNGYDAARRIRDQDWGKSMMLIALTGWGSSEDQRRATEAGFDHHCTKPIDPARLNPWLIEAVARRGPALA